MALENTLLFEGISRTGLTGVLSPLMRGRATIFMLHRFRDIERGVMGHDPEMLRNVLARLRKDGYALRSAEEVIRAMLGPEPLPAGTVAFTIDDGYYDHAEIAGPVFAEFDCPVTTFVTTGFIDRELWFWWDRIEYVLAHYRNTAPLVEIGTATVRYDLSSEPGAHAARADFTGRCKAVSEEEKNAAIVRLAIACDVELPTEAPPRYAPLTWDQLRTREGSGMTFGPHTRTHPILGRVSDAQAEAELFESWARLRKEAAKPSPVFCYPNGQPGDFGPREFALLERVGLLGAVVGTPGYVTRADASSGLRRFEVPRYSYPDSVNGVLRYASGVERALQIVRRKV